MIPVISTDPQPARMIPSATLAKGDMVVGRVLAQTAPYRYRVIVKGQHLQVQSNLVLQEGDSLLLELVQTMPVLRFRMLENFSRQLPEEWMPILMQHLEGSPSQLSNTIVRMALLYQMPLNPEQIKNLIRLHRKQFKNKAVPEEEFVRAYFFPQHLNPASAPLKDPFLFLKWYLGEFQLTRWIRQLKKRSDAQGIDLPENLLASLDTATSLQEWFQKLGIFYEAQWKRFFPKTAVTGNGELKPLLLKLATDAGLREAQELLDALEFVQVQLLKFQKGLWAAFPILHQGAETFFFFKKEALNLNVTATRFKLDLQTERFGNIFIRGIVNGGCLKLDFYNNVQVFLDAVDKRMTELKETMKRFGIADFQYNVFPSARGNSALKEIFSEEASTISWIF